MLIEGAERFGLAQLHQLRVGSAAELTNRFVFCLPYVVRDRPPPPQTIENNFDGFALAEADLALRGPANFWVLPNRVSTFKKWPR